MREFDGDAPYDGLDERRELYWSGDWRLLEERIDEGFSAGVRDIDVVAQQFWGERHLDDAVLRRRRDEPGTWANDAVSTAYALTDVQFNAAAQVDEGAQLLERVVYEPYGRALHHRPHDVDGDGDADANDQQIISDLASPPTGIADAAYRVEADLNHDGVIDANDSGHFNALGFAAGLGAVVSDASAADNAFGFAGYHFDRETRQYHVRHRVYDPALGRFIERDPLGYADGMSLYEYVGSSPFVGLDPMGLLGDAPLDFWTAIGGGQSRQYVHTTWEPSGRSWPEYNMVRTAYQHGQTVPGSGQATAEEMYQASRGSRMAGHSEAQSEWGAAQREMLNAAAEEGASTVRDVYGPLSMATGGPALGAMARGGVVDAVEAVARKLGGTGADAGDDCIRLVNGRRPINSRYAGNKYPLDKLPAEVAAKYPDSVRFTKEGFPDFSPYSEVDVQISGLTGNRGMDAIIANRTAGLDATPEGYVWHHVEDGRTMQLVPGDLHNAVRHTGGAAIVRGGG